MNPSALGPPAQGPTFVAPPRGCYPAHQVRAFDDAAPDPFHEPPRTTSAQPVPLEGAKQCQDPYLMDVEPRSSPSTKPGTASAPVPRQVLSLPPGTPSLAYPPSADLAPLPMPPVKEELIPIGILQDTHDHSGHSTNGAASQTTPESVLPMGKPIPNAITSSNPPPSAANRSRSNDCQILFGRRTQGTEPCSIRTGTSAKAPVLAAAGADAPVESSKGLNHSRPSMASSNRP
ncbi:uncharacterized protein LOC135216516 [Macrobrachium nipponense]|uniref:uncharacterized protein LOC135216516 n=1 Tax=Macrobrachium nipponense TaxID=159736 RepID=UPI0030C7E3B2